MSRSREDHQAIDQAHRATIASLFAFTNAYEIDAAVACFADNGVIDDPAVGKVFDGQAAIRDYLAKFFVGYGTSTMVLSMKTSAPGIINVRTDFTGTFGHEIGILCFRFDTHGSIRHLHADLEE